MERHRLITGSLSPAAPASSAATSPGPASTTRPPVYRALAKIVSSVATRPSTSGSPIRTTTRAKPRERASVCVHQDEGALDVRTASRHCMTQSSALTLMDVSDRFHPVTLSSRNSSFTSLRYPMTTTSPSTPVSTRDSGGYVINGRPDRTLHPRDGPIRCGLNRHLKRLDAVFERRRAAEVEEDRGVVN